MVTDRTADWSFWCRPAWLLTHLLVLALVAAMLAAGFWQVSRDGDRAERNEIIAARIDAPAVPIAEVAGPGDPTQVGEGNLYQPVKVAGEYRPDDEVLIRNRTFDGAPGWWVITPLVGIDGTGVLVNRGWIPRSFESTEPRPGTEADQGPIEVTGWVIPTRKAQGFETDDPEAGRLADLARTDVERIAAQLDYPVVPVVVQLRPGDTDPDRLPAPLPRPSLDAGPHMAYAIQWFIFSAIAIVGYPMILRRKATGASDSLPD